MRDPQLEGVAVRLHRGLLVAVEVNFGAVAHEAERRVHRDVHLRLGRQRAVDAGEQRQDAETAHDAHVHAGKVKSCG